MDASSFAKNLLPQADLCFGVGGIEFISPASLADEQVGFDGQDWEQSWLVLARETACGDPIFIDRSSTLLPVYTAMHGMDSWEPTPIAGSWHQFLSALDLVRPYTKGREHPVGLEEKPLTVGEQLALDEGLSSILGSPVPSFWGSLLAPGEP